MKKWIIGLLIFIAAAIAGIYIFIPRTLNISVVEIVNCNSNGTFTAISDQKKWKEWFPQKGLTHQFSIAQQLHNAALITIEKDGEIITSNFVLIAITNDSTGIQWSCALNTGEGNPFTRLQRYRRAVKIKHEMDTILSHLSAFAGKTENVYGFPMQRLKFSDSLLIATRTTTKMYPSTSEIYELVRQLQKHVQGKNAQVIGYPMLNVSQINTDEFQVMVALAVDRKLEDEKSFFFRRMVPGYFIRADVKGGPGTIKLAMQRLRNFLSDYRHTAMAVPFEHLETDRIAEPDTAKWITRIYVPVP